MITQKFGGSSVATTASLQQVIDIILENRSVRVVTCSAPGRRSHGDDKVTDLLIRTADGCDDARHEVQERFMQIAVEMGYGDWMETELEQALHGAEYHYVVSRGEYLMNKLLAHMLHMPFIDPTECVFIRSDGTIDLSQSVPAIRAILSQYLHTPVVIAPFYGQDQNGRVRTIARNGSDTSGALYAVAAYSRRYEVWTDVDGVWSADPRVVRSAVPLQQLSSKEYLDMHRRIGAQVVAPEAVEICRAYFCPLWIRSTFNTEGRGTKIVTPVKQYAVRA